MTIYLVESGDGGAWMYGYNVAGNSQDDPPIHTRAQYLASGTAYSGLQELIIGDDDSAYVSKVHNASSDTTARANHMFEIAIDDNETLVTQIDSLVKAQHFTDSTDTASYDIYLYIWDFEGEAWVEIDTNTDTGIRELSDSLTTDPEKYMRGQRITLLLHDYEGVYRAATTTTSRGSCLLESTKLFTDVGLQSSDELILGQGILGRLDGVDDLYPLITREIHYGETHRVFTFDMGGGITFQITDTHMMITEEGNMRAAQLRPGDKLWHKDNGWMLIQSRTQELLEGNYYNLETGAADYYLECGILIHNMMSPIGTPK